MKARKLKVCINMDNDCMYCVYRNGGQGSITPGIMSHCRFSITYVCGPASVKLITHLISKVRKVKWQNGCLGPITLGVISLRRIFKFCYSLKFL